MNTTTSSPSREIWFTTSKSGKRSAWYFNRRQFRAFPMPLADAEFEIATGAAREIPGHPFRGAVRPGHSLPNL